MSCWNKRSFIPNQQKSLHFCHNGATSLIFPSLRCLHGLEWSQYQNVFVCVCFSVFTLSSDHRNVGNPAWPLPVNILQVGRMCGLQLGETFLPLLLFCWQPRLLWPVVRQCSSSCLIPFPLVPDKSRIKPFACSLFPTDWGPCFLGWLSFTTDLNLL